MKWKIIKRLFKQTILPVLIAGAFTIYDGVTSEPGLTLAGAVKVFFPALFFIMYFYGQYKRVEKQTEDRASFEELSNDVSSIKAAVEGLQANTTPTVSTFTVSTAPAADKSEEILDEAIDLQKQGKNVASLLQAGLAFELAVRNFASKTMPSAESDNLPLLDVMRKIEKYLPEGVGEELHTLRKIRNRITHVRESELADLPDIELTMNGYRWALATLKESEKIFLFENET